MHKVLVAYISRTGMTEKMANYIAEGVRMAGHDAQVRKIADIKSENEFRALMAISWGALPITAT